MPKIRYDLRKSILDLIDQLQREGALHERDAPSIYWIPRVLTVSVPGEVVEAIQKSKLT